MTTNIRYIVDNTNDLTVYELLGLEVLRHTGPGFAMLGRGDARLFLSVPGGGAVRARTSAA